MRHLFAVVTLASTLFTLPAFAITTVMEPSLPTDIEVWKKYELPACIKYPQKVIEAKMWKKESEGAFQQIFVFYLNGEKIDQREYSRTGDSPMRYARFVRSSSQGSWLAYERNESNMAGEQMLKVLGLTSEEFAACNKQ